MEVIALGMGIQSVAMYYMSSLHMLRRADWAIFADPGKERAETYRYLELLLKWQEINNGIPIKVKSDKNLFEDLLRKNEKGIGRFVSIPAYVSDNGSVGMLRRQCTREYKIEVVDKAIRELYNLSPRQRCPPTTIWKGISLDEIDRMTAPRVRWKTHYYPFCGYWIMKAAQGKTSEPTAATRSDLIEWYRKMGFPVPVKSACVFCPYRSDSSWRDLKTKSPEDFEAAVAVDKAIRKDIHGKIKNDSFLHKSLRPLDEVNFGNAPTLDFGECSDNCGV